MNKIGKIPRDAERAWRAQLAPLDARSLALSVLLGSHPPQLPARALVALAELFGIAPGTMRTALSRMVAAGDVELSDGRYRLAGRLLDRQRAQDLGRRTPNPTWDANWHIVVTTGGRRPIAARRSFRAEMLHHRMGELDPGSWIRPANLPAPRRGDGRLVITGTLDHDDPAGLAAGLWDLAALGDTAGAIDTALELQLSQLDWLDPASIPEAFHLAAAAVRLMLSDPVLPPRLLPAAWPVDRLRRTYDRAEHQLRTLLQGFLRSVTNG